MAEVREALLRSLATIGKTDLVIASLAAEEPPVRRGAMVGLLRSGDIEGVMASGGVLLEASRSSLESERILAAQVLGAVGAKNFYRPLLTLMQDESPRVRQAAVTAAAELKHPDLWPPLFNALRAPATRTVAQKALAAGGDTILPQLETTFLHEADLRRYIIRICGSIRGERVEGFLKAQLRHEDDTLRREVYAALRACGYCASESEQYSLETQLRAETAQALGTLAMLADLGDDTALTPLQAALTAAFKETQERIFHLLAFLYPADTIRAVEDALKHGSANEQAYALEVLDNLLSREAKGTLLPLFEPTSPKEKLERLKEPFGESRERRLKSLLTSPNPWTRACALYAVGKLRVEGCEDLIRGAQESPIESVRETAQWALKTLAGDKQGDRMLTVEKVLVLKAVSLFSETPDDVLIDVASLLEELEVKAGEVIFRKNDLERSLYIIIVRSRAGT